MDMYSPEDITLFVGVCLLLVLVGILIQLWNHFAPPAKYCHYCGCPTKPEWHIEQHYYDGKTGKGTEKLREYWVCSYKDKGLERYKHYEFRSRKTKTLTVDKWGCT